MKSPLRLAREKRGLTLHALAVLVGSDVGNLSRIERGVQTPSRELAAKICEQFGGEIDEMQLIYPERYAQQDTSPNLTDGIPPDVDPDQK